MNAGRVGQGCLGDTVRAMGRRWTSLACGLGLVLGSALTPVQAASQVATQEATQNHLALGLIVKLKDKQTASVVRLPASVRPSDNAQAQRLRMAAAANRKRVSYLVQKPTAFGAQVIHQGHYTTVAEAEAEAAKLRQDPDVEWVAVNQMEKPAAVNTAVAFPVLPASSSQESAYASHKWMQRRTDAGAGVGVAGFRSAWDTLSTAILNHALSPVVVAVLDTGKLSHPDLDGRMLPGYDFVSEVEFARDGNSLDADPTDPGDYLLQSEINANPTLYGSTCTAHDSSWHGVSVMSMLTPMADSTVMGPAALSMLPADIGRVLPVRIGGTCGALVSDIIEGLLWAAGVDYQGSPARNPNPARVINISFGSTGNCLSNGTGDTLYRQTIATLATKGALVVSSAGNGDGSANAVGYVGATRPASCPGVMAVTALRYNGSKATYANTVDGTQSGSYSLAVAGGDAAAYVPNVAPAQTLNLLTNLGSTSAQGFALESNICFSGGCYVSEGTSFAAPQVAAVAALVLAIHPSATVDELRTLLQTTATSYTSVAVTGLPTCDASTANCKCTQATCGYGILDANAAVTEAISRANSLGGNSFSSPDLYASYFTPDRLKSTSKGGGGGGAADDLSLLALLAAVLGLAWWRVRTDAQARAMRPVRIRGDIKGGKR